jgi:hypothetical protein
MKVETWSKVFQSNFGSDFNKNSFGKDEALNFPQDAEDPK